MSKARVGAVASPLASVGASLVAYPDVNVALVLRVRSDWRHMNCLGGNVARVERWTEFFLPCIAVAAMAWLAPYGPAAADSSSLPAPVIEFVSRRASCIEWHKKSSDPKQEAQIDEIMRSLRCADIKGEEQALRTSYADNPGVMAALNGTWTKIIERMPVHLPPATLPSGPND